VLVAVGGVRGGWGGVVGWVRGFGVMEVSSNVEKHAQTAVSPQPAKEAERRKNSAPVQAAAKIQ